MKKSCLWIVFLLFSLISKGDLKMVSFGDSITSAALASFAINQVNSPDPHDKLYRQPKLNLPQHSTYRYDPPYKDFGSHSYSKFIQSPQLSWSTGTEVRSFYQYLAKYKKISKVANYAVTGSSTFDLHSQIEKAIGEQNDFDLATVLIGGNNLCNNDNSTNPTNGYQQLRVALLKILANTHAKVLVLDVPSIDNLAYFQNDVGVLGLTCNQIWNMPKFYCSRLLADLSIDKVNWVQTQVRIMNKVIQNAVADIQKKFPDRIRLISVFQGHPIDPNNMSTDCFHPNVFGQQEIAQRAWYKILDMKKNGDNFLDL